MIATRRLVRCILTTAIVLSAAAGRIHAQTIWSESFAYPDGTTTGANLNTANPAPDWTSTCPSCITGDWYEVRSGQMEGLDTNGPASLETESIDISAYPAGVEVRIDLSEQGDMEDCPGGISPGCNSVDWIQISYQLNGGAWQDASSSAGGPCTGPCAGASYYAIGNFDALQARICPLQGNTLRLRIAVQTWATDEIIRIDNIDVSPQTCQAILTIDSILPVTCPGFNDGAIFASGAGASPLSDTITGGGTGPVFDSLAPGTYTITLTDANSLTATQTVTVPGPIFSTPTADAGPGDTLCPGDTFQLQGSASGAGPAYTYTWTPASGLSDPAIPDPIATLGIGATSYVLTVTSNGCPSATDTVFLAAFPAPIVHAGNDTTLCLGDTLPLIPTVTGQTGPLDIQWTGPSGLLNPAGPDTLFIQPQASGQYTLAAIPPSGCASLPDTLSLLLERPLTLDAPPGITACPGEPLQIGLPPISGLTYAWSPPAGLDDPSIPQPRLTAESGTSYTLTVTDTALTIDRCRIRTFNVPVAIGPCIFQNVMTPNGDGINDLLDIGPHNQAPSLTIFDRWGAAVFHSSAYQNDWAGLSAQGKPLPEGVYYYILHTPILPAGGTDASRAPYHSAHAITLLR